MKFVCISRPEQGFPHPMHQKFLVQDAEVATKIAAIESGTHGQYTSIEVQEVPTGFKSFEEQMIDEETFRLIKEWCKSQGKHEEYFLRCSRDSEDFLLYNSSVEQILEAQRLKKLSAKLID